MTEEKIRLHAINVLFYEPERRETGPYIVRSIYDKLDPINMEMQILVEDAVGRNGSAAVSSDANLPKETLDEIAMCAEFEAIKQKLEPIPSHRRYFFVSMPYEDLGNIPKTPAELKAVHDVFVMRRAFDSIVKGGHVRDAFRKWFGEDIYRTFTKNLGKKNELVLKCRKEMSASYNAFVKAYGRAMDIDMFVFSSYGGNGDLNEIVARANTDLPLLGKCRWIVCRHESEPLPEGVERKVHERARSAEIVTYNDGNVEAKVQEIAENITRDSLSYKTRKRRPSTVIRTKRGGTRFAFEE